MNQFRVESNNIFPFQQGTPTKLACPIKEKPKFRGEYAPSVHTRATYLQNQVCQLIIEKGTQNCKQMSQLLNEEN